MSRFTHLSIFSLPLLLSLSNPLSQAATIPVADYSLLATPTAINAAGSPQSAPTVAMSSSMRPFAPAVEGAISYTGTGTTTTPAPVPTVTAELLALQRGEFLPGHESPAEEADLHPTGNVNGVTYSSTKEQDANTADLPLNEKRHHAPNTTASSSDDTANAIVLPPNIPSIIAAGHIQLHLSGLVIAIPFPSSLSGYLRSGSTFTATEADDPSSFQGIRGNGTAISKPVQHQQEKRPSNLVRMPIPQSAIDAARSAASASATTSAAYVGEEPGRLQRSRRGSLAIVTGADADADAPLEERAGKENEDKDALQRAQQWRRYEACLRKEGIVPGLGPLGMSGMPMPITLPSWKCWAEAERGAVIKVEEKNEEEERG